MKKLLSALVALAMLGSMSVMAFAEEQTDTIAEEDTAVVEEVVGDAEEEVPVDESEVVDSEGVEAIDPTDAVEGDTVLDQVDMDGLKEIAGDVKDGILNLIESGKVEEAISDVLSSISNLKLDDLYNLESNKAADILTGIANTLDNWGVDLDALYAKVKDSKLLNLFASMYVPDIPQTTEPTTVTTTADPTDPETTDPETTTPPTENPKTGSASAVAAFAVMSVAAAAAFVSYKKKAE